jgi:hypothetical protein
MDDGVILSVPEGIEHDEVLAPDEFLDHAGSYFAAALTGAFRIV